MEDVLTQIDNLREIKGKEEEMNKKIDDLVVRLFLEKALIYQHLKDYKRMSDLVFLAEKYVETYKVSQWKSRIFRFKGRVFDYQKKYKQAVLMYQKAIGFMKSDPDYLKGSPLELEYKAFEINSKMRHNLTKISVTGALKFYKSFEVLDRARKLKQKDYATWAIWRTGVLVRLLQVLLEKKSKILSKEEMLGWIESARHDLHSGEKFDFSYRLSELSDLEKKIKL